MSTVSSLEEGRPRPKGAVLFTGPDGIGDYKTHVEEQFYIGHGCMSPEASSNTEYICRAAPNVPHPPPKTARVGEIGWGVPRNVDYSLLKSGEQIMLKEFRQALEDRYTHRYQNPHYPLPTSSRVTYSQQNSRDKQGITNRLYIRKIEQEKNELGEVDTRSVSQSPYSSHTSI